MNILEARRRTLGKGVYKKTVEGNPAIAQGSLARMYPGIKMQGWTEQSQYEGNQLIDTSLVVETDLIKKSFGKITPKTSAVYTATIYSDEATKIASLEPGDYYFYFFSERSFNSPYLEYTENGETKTVNMNTSFSVSSPASVTSIKCGGINVSTEVTYEAQINVGTSALAYEPVYTGGAPSPSPEYPQPITNAGKYNEEVQKWEYEITIANAQADATKNQTVLLTSDRPLTKWDKLEKRNGQWGWVYKSEEIESYMDESVPGEYYSTTGQLSVGAQVWHETATETFVPLSESEQEAMNALYTFRPTTVLSNDAGCEMSLTYKTKKSLEVTT